MNQKIDIDELDRFRIGEPFPSRKNRVYRIQWRGGICVAKIYTEDSRHRSVVEYRILTECERRGIRVPAPREFDGRVLIMEYISGENASVVFDRWFEANEDAKLVQLCISLSDWLALFHRTFAMRLARGDSILKNFVIKGKDIYGVDFEEASGTDPLADVGELCAFVLSSDPMFTDRKFALIRALADHYRNSTGTDRSDALMLNIATALEHYAQFRAGRKPMLEWAGRFRSGEVRF